MNIAYQMNGFSAEYKLKNCYHLFIWNLNFQIRIMNIRVSVFCLSNNEWGAYDSFEFIQL